MTALSTLQRVAAAIPEIENMASVAGALRAAGREMSAATVAAEREFIRTEFARVGISTLEEARSVAIAHLSAAGRQAAYEFNRAAAIAALQAGLTERRNR